MVNLLDDMLFAAIPAVGFALVFNVPPKALKYCAILGALGHVTRTFITTLWCPNCFCHFFSPLCDWFYWGAFISSLFSPSESLYCCGNYSNDSRCSAYKAMIAIVQIHHYGFSDKLFEQMISSFINTSFILGALVLGLALPGLLFYRQKPVV